MSDVNGVSQPAETPDRLAWEPLGLLADVSPEALERIAIQMNAGFAETQRRDGNAVDHARRMTRAVFGVLVALGIAVGVIVWMFAHSREIEVVVQTVVYDKKGSSSPWACPSICSAMTRKMGNGSTCCSAGC